MQHANTTWQAGHKDYPVRGTWVGVCFGQGRWFACVCVFVCVHTRETEKRDWFCRPSGVSTLRYAGILCEQLAPSIVQNYQPADLSGWRLLKNWIQSGVSSSMTDSPDEGRNTPAHFNMWTDLTLNGMCVLFVCVCVCVCVLRFFSCLIASGNMDRRLVGAFFCFFFLVAMCSQTPAFLFPWPKFLSFILPVKKSIELHNGEPCFCWPRVLTWVPLACCSYWTVST